MAKPMSLKPFEYILERERKLPAKQQTTYILQRPNADTSAEIEDMVEQGLHDDGIFIRKNRGRMVLAYLRNGFKGWINFPAGDDTDIEFSAVDKLTELCPMVNISMLEPEDRFELAEVISEGVKLNEEESKN